MVTPRRELSSLTPGQLFREEESGRLQQREVIAELQRRQALESERRQRQLAQQERAQELADVQAQRREILGSPRAREVARIELQRQREARPRALAPRIERIEPIPGIPREPPPVRREVVQRLSEAEIRRRVEARELSPIQARPELERRAANAATQQERQRIQRTLQRIEPLPAIQPLPRPIAKDIQSFTDAEGTNLVAARRGGITEEKLREQGFKESDIKSASKQSAALSRLDPFTDRQGNIQLDDALDKGLTVSTLRDAGIAQSDIDAAVSRQRLRQQVQPFTDKEGNIDLIAARRQGISEKALRDLGVDQKNIAEANRSIKAQDTLKPFTDKQGNIDAISARQRGISESILRDAGVEQSFIEKEIRPTLALVKKLQPFTNSDGTIRIDEAARKLSAKDLIDSQMGRQLLPDLTLARKRNTALDKIKRVQGAVDKEGNINLSAAVRQGVSNQVMRDAGFSQADVKSANARVVAFNRLAPFTVRDPETKEVGIDLVAAVSRRELLGGGVIAPGAKRGVNDELLKNAGFTQAQIDEAKEVSRQLTPLPNTRAWYAQIGKTVGVQAADALIPGLWARNWNQLSNKDKAVNIAFDALYVVPLVGGAVRATGKAARAASRLSRAERGTKKVLSNVKAAQKTEPSDVGQRLANVERLKNQAELQQLNRIVRSEQQKAKVPDFQKRIDQIDRIESDLQKRRALESLAKDLNETGIEKDILKGRISATDLNARLRTLEKLDNQDSLQQLNLLVKREQSKLKNPNFQKRIDQIDKIESDLQKRRALESLARDIPNTKPGPEVLKGRIASSDLDSRLQRVEKLGNQERLQQLNRLVKSEQQKAKDPNFQKRIDQINKVDDEIQKSRLLEAYLQELASPGKLTGLNLRLAEANLIKSANAIKKSVRAAGGTAADAKIAERATLEIGDALIQGLPKALPAPAKRLAIIGRKYDITALVERVGPLTEGGQKVSDLFRNARRTADDLPDAPGNIKNRITRIEDSLSRIDEQLKDIPTARQQEALATEIRQAQSRIETIRQQPRTAARERRIERLQERVSETRRQVEVMERPQVRPLIEVRTVAEAAQPIATKQQAARVAARQQRSTRSVALIREGVAVKPTRTTRRLRPAILPTPAMTEAERQAITNLRKQERAIAQTRAQLQTAPTQKRREQLRTKLSTQQKQAEKTRSTVAAGVKASPVVAAKIAPTTATTTKLAPATAPVTTPAPKAPPVTVTRTKPTTKAPPITTTKAPPAKPPRRPRFDLPGDAEKQLKPGEFPRVVTWRQGAVNITVDIDRGTRAFSKAKGSGKGTSPDETFRVVRKDKTEPTAKEFDQGVVKLNVTPRRVFFSRRRINRP